MNRKDGVNSKAEEKQVTVRMLSVDGSNMTKAFFYQLRSSSMFIWDEDNSYYVVSENIHDIWGYVVDGASKYIMYKLDGKLQRMSVDGALYSSVTRHSTEWREAVRKVMEDLDQLFIAA